MSTVYHVGETFDKVDHPKSSLAKGEYERCRFLNSDLSNADMADIKFIDCEFEGCNLSLASLTRTAFRDVKFKGCKMLGLHFESCNEFGLSVSFDNCNLTHSSCYGVKLKKTLFINSKLEIDFTAADLSQSVFDRCDLLGAKFENTILEKADFRSSFNYSIDPELNRIKRAKFSMPEVCGLLDKYDLLIDRGNGLKG